MTPWLIRHDFGALGDGYPSFSTSACDAVDGVVFCTNYDFTHVTKIDYHGYVKWQVTDVNNSDAVVGADASGNVFIADRLRLTKLNAAGVIQWQKGTSTGFVSGGNARALTVLADGSCLVVSGNTDSLLRIAKFGPDGSLTAEKEYTGATDEIVNSTKNFIENASGDLYHVDHDTTGDSYIKIVKFYAALDNIARSKSYKCAGYSLSALGSCELSDGSMVVAFLDAGTTGTLRLARIAEDSTVTWSKSVTDSGVTNYFSRVSIFSAPDGFFVCATSSVNNPLLYKFANDGSLSWARSLHHPSVDGVWVVDNAFVDSTGDLVCSATLNDASANATACLFKIYADGTPTGNFGGATAAVTNHTTVSVASGITLTVADDTSATIVGTSGTVTTSAAQVSASSYPLTLHASDLTQTGQASGLKASHHGQANSPYRQVGTATGTLETKHGIAMSVTRTPSGKTICAAIGTQATKHGQAIGTSLVTSAAAGHLAIKHGTAQGKIVCAATGALVTKHGTATCASAFQATGSRAIKHGTALTLTIRAATGHLATKHGTASSTWGSTGQATGHLATNHGTPTFKSIFKAMPNFKTRHGTPKSIRSTTC